MVQLLIKRGLLKIDLQHFFRNNVQTLWVVLSQIGFSSVPNTFFCVHVSQVWIKKHVPQPKSQRDLNTFEQPLSLVVRHGQRTPNEGINQSYLPMWQTKYGIGNEFFGRAVKAISSLGVRSPCCQTSAHFHENLREGSLCVDQESE